MLRTRRFDSTDPLKESCDISFSDSIFKWKYLLWYCENLSVKKVR
ncbi:DUF3737 family protein [Peribacillus simplex]